MDGTVLSILWDLLAFVISIVAMVGIRFLVEKLGTEKLKRVQTEWDQIKELATVAVKYAEQAYMSYGGAQKKEQALVFLSRELAQRGIQVSEEAIGDFIEAALREIKDKLGEEWANVVKETA